MAAERLQKIISQVGIASRRNAEELIRGGLVTVNGKVAKLGDKADPGRDAIKVSGKLISQAAQSGLVYLAFHKPKGVISMNAPDDQGRPTLSHYLRRVKTKVHPIGRMDFNGEGLILLTNDGTLLERIQKNPNILKIYEVKVFKHPDQILLSRLIRGTTLPEAPDQLKRSKYNDQLIRPVYVDVKKKLTNKTKIEVGFIGPGSPPVKEFFQACGFLVERMVRLSIGHLSFGKLLPGAYTRLEKKEFETLLQSPEKAYAFIPPRPTHIDANLDTKRKAFAAQKD